MATVSLRAWSGNAMMRPGGGEVSAKHGREAQRNGADENDGEADGRDARANVRTAIFELVDGIQRALHGGDADGGRPDGGDEAEGNFAGGRGGGGLIEGVQHRAQRRGGKDERKVIEKAVIYFECGPRGEAEDGAGAEQGGKEREEEIETELGGAVEDLVGHEGFPGAHGHGFERGTLQIPEIVKRRGGDHFPDSTLAMIYSPVYISAWDCAGAGA
jgi:hypothetical protein